MSNEDRLNDIQKASPKKQFQQMLHFFSLFETFNSFCLFENIGHKIQVPLNICDLCM